MTVIRWDRKTGCGLPTQLLHYCISRNKVLAVSLLLWKNRYAGSGLIKLLGRHVAKGNHVLSWQAPISTTSSLEQLALFLYSPHRLTFVHGDNERRQQQLHECYSVLERCWSSEFATTTGSARTFHCWKPKGWSSFTQEARWTDKRYEEEETALTVCLFYSRLIHNMSSSTLEFKKLPDEDKLQQFKALLKGTIPLYHLHDINDSLAFNPRISSRDW